MQVTQGDCGSLAKLGTIAGQQWDQQINSTFVIKVAQDSGCRAPYLQVIIA
jgi:hypothetical protein